MKTIIWIIPRFKLTIKFMVNWLEYIILKNVFIKRKTRIIKDKELKGEKIDIVICDEVADIDWDKFKEHKIKRKWRKKK